MSDNMIATKTCKQCGKALPLTAFGTKQARCKQCINALRAGKAKLAGDTDRVTHYEASQALNAAMRDSRLEGMQWLDRFQQAPDQMHPSAATSVLNYLAMCHNNTGNFTKTLASLNSTAEAALQSGQILNATIALVNL